MLCSGISAQTNQELIKLRKLSLENHPDTKQFLSNRQFIVSLRQMLREKREIQWDSLPFVSHLASQDGNIDLCTWNIIQGSDVPVYFGLIQIQHKKKIYQTILEQSPESWKQKVTQKEWSPAQWPGAIYYQLIEVGKKKNRYYVLLGFNTESEISNKKIIETLNIQANGKVSFGKKVFNIDKKWQHRLIFEYGKDVSMSIKYHPENQWIVFDHLSPEENSKTGFYSFYGPDFSYDALQLQKEKSWLYIKDIDVKSNFDKPFNVEPKKKEKKIYEPK